MKKNDLADRIRRRLEEIGQSPITVAQQAGLERTYIRDFLSGKKASIKADRLPAIARALDLPLDELTGPLHGDIKPSNIRTVAGDILVGARDFPIYAAAMGGKGHMILTTDVIEYVKRPVILEGVPDSYGISVVGESMVPAYRAGDMALVHPRLQPSRDTDVVLFDHDHRTGEAQAMIKHLVGINDRQWKVEQYRPAETFTVHRADWPICHRVVGSYKAR